MNKKHPFTNAGVQQLLKTLNLLSPIERKTEALSLHQNFKSWLSNHFDFTPEQSDHLHAIDVQTLSFMAYSLSFALSNDLPIRLIKQQKPNKPVIKIIETRNQTKVSSAVSDGTEQVTGKVIIKISYT